MKNPVFIFKQLHFLVVFVFMVQFSYGEATIEGVVKNEVGELIPFANVLLIKASDSTFVKGTITNENGEFLIENIPEGQYMVTISMMGYNSISVKPFSLNRDSKLMLPPIILFEGLELDEVVVVSKKNLYVQKIDRMVINVASSILSSGSSALEILERSPGVVVNRQNGAISLVGKNGVVVMINGKQSYMPTSSLVQLLEGMSSDNIETIELITTPPANFDAEGNAGFINIVLKTLTDRGLNGSYSLSGGVGNGNTTSDNINFNFRRNKLNIFGNYSFLRNTQRQQIILNRSFINEDMVLVNKFSLSDRDPIRRHHNIRLGLDYQTSAKTIMGLLIWGNDNKFVQDAVSKGHGTENNIPSSFFELLNSERNQLKHFGSNVNLKHNFKEDGYISIDFDYLKYKMENPSGYIYNFFDGNADFLREEYTNIDKNTPITIKVGKADYSNRINDDVKLDIGMKAAFSSFDNDVLVETSSGQDFVEDPDLTNISILKEQILAAYGSVQYNISDKTNLQMGLRYEHTDSELISNTEGKVVDRAYGEFFPTVYISHKINDTLNFNFSYSRRITRPTFNDMAPFVVFIDPNTLVSGNPAIQPAISNAIKFGLNYKSIILSAQYSVEDGTISRFQARSDEQSERLIYGAANLDQTKIFSLTMGLPITFANWWKMQNNFTYLHAKILNTVDGSLFNFGQNSFNINSTQSFTLARNITSEININYNSPSFFDMFGASIIKSSFIINIAFQKRFNDKWGVLGIKVNDLFDTMKYHLITDIPGQNLNTDNIFDFANRTIILTYSRSFGNRKLKSARERGIGAEEEKQRVN